MKTHRFIIEAAKDIDSNNKKRFRLIKFEKKENDYKEMVDQIMNELSSDINLAFNEYIGELDYAYCDFLSGLGRKKRKYRVH